MIGERIGNYRILAQIGQGGMGKVYQAEDTQLGRRVAIKILNPAMLADGSMGLERFQSEARIQANLNQANVVTLLAFEPYKDSYCMIMEYVEGKTLAQLIRSIGPLPSHIAVMISKQILDGLSAAHRQGVVHRDLKPSNIMLTAEGVVKVMDFGIAKVEGGKSLTASGALVGTVSYMSPEQVRSEPLDARSDLYSFGIILFELLTGRVPFKDDSDFSNMIHHIRTAPPLPTQLLPDIPSELEDIVLRCLIKPPDQRYQNAVEVLAALDLFEERERALGRGEWYTRKMLAQWLAAPGRQQAAAAAPQIATPAAFPGAPPPQVAPLFNTMPSAPQPIPPATPSVAARHSGGKGTLAVVILVLIVLAGGSAYVYYRMPRAAGSYPSGDRGVQATSQAQIAVPPGVPSTDTKPPEQPSQALQSGAAPSAPAAAAGAKSSIGPASDANAGRTMVSAPRGGKTAPSGGAAPASSTKLQAVPPDSMPPAGQSAAAEAKPAGGFLILFDQDPSGERLSMAMAQARVADIVREAGHQVVSAGFMSSGMRESLAGGDYAGMRRGGVGYVIAGTAHGAVEPQTAYGSTYYVGQVSVTFELVRMSDGKVVATGSNDAKSKGSANAAAALNNALMAATADAVRELLRK